MLNHEPLLNPKPDEVTLDPVVTNNFPSIIHRLDY
jgi:hypothetical protein